MKGLINIIKRTLSSKNQVTIPKAVRKQLSIKSHQAVSFQRIHNQIVIKLVKRNNRLMQLHKSWERIAKNTKKYGSDDTSNNWGKDVGSEKLNNKRFIKVR